MPCRPQSYNLLCIVSQGKTGHSFHISYKNNLLTCGYVVFTCWEGEKWCPVGHRLSLWVVPGLTLLSSKAVPTPSQRSWNWVYCRAAGEDRDHFVGKVSIHFSWAWRASGILFTDYSFNPYLRFSCEQPPRLLFKILYKNRLFHSPMFFHQHVFSNSPSMEKDSWEVTQ